MFEIYYCLPHSHTINFTVISWSWSWLTIFNRAVYFWLFLFCFSIFTKLENLNQFVYLMHMCDFHIPHIINTRRQNSSKRIVFVFPIIISLPSAEFNMQESSNNKSFWKATTCNAFNRPSLAVIRLVHWFITHILTLTIWETLLFHYYIHIQRCWWGMSIQTSK